MDDLYSFGFWIAFIAGVTLLIGGIGSLVDAIEDFKFFWKWRKQKQLDRCCDCWKQRRA